MDYSSRIHRLFHIITLVQGSAGITARVLADKFDLTERHIYRDIDVLKESGVPISHDPDTGGYRIRKDFFLRPIDLTLEEAMALALLADQVGASEQIPHTAHALKAAEKVRSILPAAIREMLDQLTPRVQVALARSSNEPTADVYTSVRNAITNRRALDCRYESRLHKSANDSAPFCFDPYDLYFGQRAWYAVGYHHGRRGVRTLKLSRFIHCKETDTPYFIPEDFSLARHFGQAWRMVPSGTLYDVRLHFAPTFAETVADTHWHDSQTVDWLDDGSIEVSFKVDGLEEIIWWVLSYGPYCRVIEPPELRARVIALHAQAAAQ